MPKQDTVHPRLSDFADEAVELIPQIFNLVIRDDQFQCKDFELTISQLRILRILHNRGKVTMTQLSEELHVAPPSTTSTTDRLVNQGFISRRHDPEDRRVVRVTLTPKGKSMMNKFLQVKKSRWHQIMVSLSKKDRENLILTLRRLVSLLEKADERNSQEKGRRL